MASLLDFNTVSPTDFEFSATKTNSMGGQSVYINHKGEKVRFELPSGRVPFGLSVQSFDDSATKITLDCSLGNLEDQTDMAAWHAWLVQFDQHMLNIAHERSEEWFKKQLKPEILAEFHKPAIQRSKDDKYPPTFKMKLPVKGDKADVAIYNAQEELVGQELVEKGCHVRTIVELTGVWFVNKMFGVSWKVLQMQVFPVAKFNTFAFSKPITGVSGGGQQAGSEEEVEADDDDDVYDEESN